MAQTRRGGDDDDINGPSTLQTTRVPAPRWRVIQLVCSFLALCWCGCARLFVQLCCIFRSTAWFERGTKRSQRPRRFSKDD